MYKLNSPEMCTRDPNYFFSSYYLHGAADHRNSNRQHSLLPLKQQHHVCVSRRKKYETLSVIASLLFPRRRAVIVV